MTDILKSLLRKAFDPKMQKIILLAAAVLFACLWIQSCRSKQELKAEAERKEAISEQNQRALTDSLHHEKNKNGDVEAIKSSFVSTIADLKKTNSDLYAESKKEIGNLIALVKGNASVNTGGVTISNSLVKYPDGQTFGLAFDKTQTDSGLVSTIKGESKFKMENNTIFPGSTDIIENKMKIKMVLGFTEDDKNYRVFARSVSPKVEFDDLSGVLLIQKKPGLECPPAPKKKRFGVGAQIGIGLGPNLQPSPFVGIGVSYNLISF